MLSKLYNIDRRIVYLLFFLVTAGPFLRPVFLPMDIADYTKGTYETIEKLKPGDVVLIDIRFSASTIGELNPPYEAIMKHIASRPGVRMLWFCTDVNGPVFAENGIKIAEAAGKVYGKDLAYLGFLAGEETAIAAVSQDLPKAFPVDSRGNRIETLEAAKGVKNGKDISLVINMSSGGLGPLGWVRQTNIPFGTPIVSVVSQVMVPAAIPYWQAKQLVGLISGLQGAAEYEQLLGTPGLGMASMGAQTFGHLYVILLVLLSNIAYLATKGKRGERRAN